MHLDRGSAAPLHLQLYDRLRQAVLTGTLAAGERLPSTRSLAQELGVSRSTVLAAYEQLVAEGYLEGRAGGGTRVAAELPEHLLQVPAPLPAETSLGGARRLAARGRRLAEGSFGPDLRLRAQVGPRAFSVAVPALDALPLELWSRLVARRARCLTPAQLDYQDARGLPRLRAAVASHLSVARGVRCTGEQVLVTAGAQSAIDLAVRVLLDPGDLALVEDPAHLGIRGVLRGAGVEILPVALDGEGMKVGEPAAMRSGARLAFVTPSNQFPTAVTLSLPRRLALLEWARAGDAWILEDDYDSEFRFSGRPLEPLQALDRAGRVLYVGSFSKMLYPSLRLGYLVLPPDLVEPFAAARRFLDVHPPLLLQEALADFIEEGHLARHLRRMRPVYAERGEALHAALRRRLDGAVTLARPQAGLHAVAWLAEGLQGEAVAAAAAQRGVEARPLSLYALAPVAPALVLGFGALPPAAIEAGVERLARALEAVRSGATR